MLLTEVSPVAEQSSSFAAELSSAYAADWSRLRRLSARIVGDDRAEEVVQEAVMRLWRAPERFDPRRGTLAGYLTVLCRGAAIDRIRADAARTAREARSAWGSDLTYSLPAAVDDRMVTEALAGLPERERTPIVLAMYDGMSYRQIAASLALPEGTVKSRIRAGLRRLRDSLEPDALR